MKLLQRTNEPLQRSLPLHPANNANHLERVSGRIQRAILNFCASRGAGYYFYADELRRFVYTKTGATAPGSADRVLRHLRQKGALAYTVVNRRASHYRIDAITEEPRP